MGWKDDPVVTAKAAPAWASDPVVDAKPITASEKFVKGLTDPIDAGAQLLTNALPTGLVEAGNKANNWLADKTGMVAKLPQGGVDQAVRQQDATYQARRAAAGEEGFDGFRLTGNLLSPANLALGYAAPAAATTVGRMGVGAGLGLASSALTPVTSGDFWEEKRGQATAGAVIGGAAAPVANALGRLISPAASTNPQINALRAEGVRPTVGQTMGGFWNRMEEKATSIPIMGDMIANARRGAAEDMNRAAFNRALKPLGKELPANVPIGRAAVEHVGETLGDAYNKLLPNLTFRADQPFAAAVQRVQNMVNTGAMDPTRVQAFNRLLQNDFLAKLNPQGVMTGQTMKQVEADLGQHIGRLGQSSDADDRLVGDALKEVQRQLREALQRSNPGQAKELRAINEGYANFKRVQRAAGFLGAEDGIFSPANMQNAVKAMDKSKDKARFAEGNALMQDLSDPAKTVLGAKVPDSGTPGRLLNLAAVGSASVSPAIPGALMAGGLLYTRPVQNALTYLMTQRGQGAQTVANALRQTSPLLAPASTQIGLESLK